MTNGEKFKEVFGFGADGSRVIAVNATWWDCDFQNRKPLTNADRIRVMSDGELAEIMALWCPPNDPHECHRYEKSDGDLNCSKCWFNWLKEEAESEEEE